MARDACAAAATCHAARISTANREVEMNQAIAAALGGTICCIVPLLCCFAGWYVGRNGVPVELHWRKNRPDDEEE